jgi:hypothetical protein
VGGPVHEANRGRRHGLHLGDRGNRLRGMGIVSGEPALGYDDDEDEDPFRRSARDLGPALYAPLATTEVFDRPISRSVCLADLILRTLPNLAFPERFQLPGHARTRGQHQRRVGRAHEGAPRTAAPTDGSIHPRTSRPPVARCAFPSSEASGAPGAAPGPPSGHGGPPSTAPSPPSVLERANRSCSPRTRRGANSGSARAGSS